MGLAFAILAANISYFIFAKKEAESEQKSEIEMEIPINKKKIEWD